MAAARVLLEDFPKTEFQAKFFIKNAVAPSRVFVLQCSKDICQERIFSLGASNPAYIPSSLLAKQIQNYNNDLKKLLPYLKKDCNTTCIDSE